MFSVMTKLICFIGVMSNETNYNFSFQTLAITKGSSSDDVEKAQKHYGKMYIISF